MAHVVPPLLLAAPAPFQIQSQSQDHILWNQCLATVQQILTLPAGQQTLAAYLFAAEKNKVIVHQLQTHNAHLQTHNATLQGAAVTKSKVDKQNEKRWLEGVVAQYGDGPSGFIPDNASKRLKDVFIAFLNATKHCGRVQREEALREFFHSVWGGRFLLKEVHAFQQYCKVPGTMAQSF